MLIQSRSDKMNFARLPPCKCGGQRQARISIGVDYEGRIETVKDIIMSRSRTQNLGQRCGGAIAHIFHDVAFHNVLEGNSSQRVDSGGDGATYKRKRAQFDYIAYLVMKLTKKKKK